jgi:valyl-tRNA synthetase
MQQLHRPRKSGSDLSADWDRDLFTLDPKLNKIINETFFKMFEDGLIYRGKYIINQCPHCRTALADVDTEHREMRGIFAYILYPFVEDADNDEAERSLGHRGVMIATTRPETMLADTAVAVHPDDPRYYEIHRKEVIVTLC